MATPLQEIWTPEAAASLVEPFRDPDTDDNFFAGLFEMGGTMEIPGKFVSVDEHTWTRGTAAVVAPDGRAHETEILDRKNRVYEPLHVREKKKLPISELRDLRMPGQMAANASARIGKAVEDLMKKCRRTRNLAAVNILLGSLADTDIPFTDLDFSISISRTTDGVSASWATAGTDILGDLVTFDDTFRSNAGKNLRHLIANNSMLSHLRGNTGIQNWFQTVSGGPRADFADALVVEANLNGLGGIPRWDIVDSGYEDANGNFSKYMPDNALIGLPEDKSFLEMHEGRAWIPASVYGRSETDDMFIPFPTTGFYWYLKIDDDPPAVWVIAGDIFLPVVAYEPAVFGETDDDVTS